MKSFKINRAKWLQGSPKKFDAKESSMLDSKGNMCCLGFFAEACGIGKKRQLGQGTPSDVVQGRARVPKDMDFLVTSTIGDRDSNTREAFRLMDLNDDVKMSKANREKRLINAFAKQGITLTFYGQYPANG